MRALTVTLLTLLASAAPAHADGLRTTPVIKTETHVNSGP